LFLLLTLAVLSFSYNLQAGSLTNLAKAPASTVQILGAEKALFRALKTKGNTPKYGLIYHSTFIGRADAKNKGRISRYLANKCSIATRIDSFSDEPNRLYGEKLREQVEERLKFYETGAAPRRNVDVMAEVAKMLKVDDDDEDMKDADETPKKKKKKDKKRKADGDDSDEEVEEKKSAKKSKKAKGDEDAAETPKSEKKSAKKAKKEKDAADTPKSEKKSEKKKKKEKRKSKGGE
jgi:nucleolar protein 56